MRQTADLGGREAAVFESFLYSGLAQLENQTDVVLTMEDIQCLHQIRASHAPLVHINFLTYLSKINMFLVLLDCNYKVAALG